MSARTMCMLSGWCEKKSAMRQFSWMWFLGLGLSACTMSGNLMPSRTKNTCRAGAPQALRGRRGRRPPAAAPQAAERARALPEACVEAGRATHTQLCVARLTTLTPRVLLQRCAPDLLAWYGRARRTGKLLPTKSLRSTAQVATVSQLSPSASSPRLQGSSGLHRTRAAIP